MKEKNDIIVGERLKSLYPGKDVRQLTASYYRKKKKLQILVISAGLTLGIVFFLSGRLSKEISPDGEILRDAYDGRDKEIPAVVNSETFGKQEVTIAVDKQSYSKEEIEEAFEVTKHWLEQVMPGNNESLAMVREDLNFPDYYEEYGISISYTSDQYGLIDGSGTVKNKELQKEESVYITAELSYGKESKIYILPVVVYPPLLTEKEVFQKALEEALTEENQRQKENKTLKLPSVVKGEPVHFTKKQDMRYLYAVFMGVLCAIVLGKAMDQDLDKLYEKRKQALLFAYPDFAGKLALLTGAGMSVTGAIKKIYKDRREKTEEPFYEELGIFVRSLENGVLEERALEDLGRRSGLPQYRKFCSLLSTHMKKGSLSLKKLLENEAEEAFTKHQNHIRKLGEEAGTKLLFPMILMLLVVMVIIMVPAFMTYQIS
ncbi:MAG: type II secretion system F family protein [Lachnospiraceae bacterium]|nr:type II secretion system F family protein [Lachnospiraceae bacterium]